MRCGHPPTASSDEASSAHLEGVLRFVDLRGSSCECTVLSGDVDENARVAQRPIEQELVNNQNVHRTLDFVEDAACQGMELSRILRVACLQSVISNGLKPKTLETYRKLLLQAYGHVHLTSMINLEKSKLLCSNSSTSASSIYSILRNRLRLTQDDVNEQNPNDITYVHSVYAPLSIRLIQYCSSPGWKTIRDVLDMLPGNLIFI